MKVRPAWLAFAALPLAAGAAAQTVTRIDPDSDPTRSLGTSVTAAGNVHVIDGGTRAGANLFHSFARFDLGQGDTARWVHGAGDGASIANVVNRVTGGTPSFIEGTIDSQALPNADFWFINPSGILFGAGARLDVPAAAHFSTASELRLADGAAFAVTTPGGSTFSVAPPAAFGFDGGQGDVTVGGVGAEFLPGTGRLTLAARNVSILGIAVSGAELRLLAVGAQARETPASGAAPADLGGVLLIQDSALRLARGPTAPTGIRLGGGLVAISSSDVGTPFTDDGVSAGGPIEIAGGEIDIFSSLVSSASFGAEDSGSILIAGGDVRIAGNSIVSTDLEFGSTGFSGDIAVSGETILVEGSRVTASTQTGLPGGSVVLEGDAIRIIDGGVVAATALPTSTSDAGAVFVRGRSLHVGPASTITSSSSGTGGAGAVDIDVADRVTLVRSAIGSSAEGADSGEAGTVEISTALLELRDQSSVSTGTIGTGAAGLILVDAGDLLLDGGSTIESRSSETATGDAGVVMLFAGRVDLADGSAIRSGTSGSGNGGGILIQAREVTLGDNSRISADSRAMCWREPCTTGRAGNVAIIADRLALADASGVDELAAITSNTRGSGDAGEINLLVGALEMDGAGTLISSDTTGSGRGGTIRIDAGTIAMRREAQLSTGAFGSGVGGTIDIVADSMVMESQAAIMAQSSFEDSGAGGSVLIQAGEFVMRDVAEINTNTRGNGNAGNIDIKAGTIHVDRSFIGSDSIGGGAGGAVSLAADDIRITGGGSVSSDSLGTCSGPDCSRPGDAGSVTVTARTLTLAGDDDAVFPARSGISSQAFTEGNAGDIVVNADEILMAFGEIRSGTESEGDAGTVTVDAGRISMADRSRITTSSNPFCPDGCAAAGEAGAVKIVARESLSLAGDSEISSNTTGPGNAGTVSINTASLQADFSRISSGTAGSGDAGEILIDADRIDLRELSEIESVAGFGSAGDAGNIDVKADEIALDSSFISTSGNGTGRAGRIDIGAGEMRLDTLSVVSTTASMLAEAPGLISVNADVVRIDNGSFIISASGSRADVGGEVRIEADRLVLGQLAQVNSNNFGPGPGGNVSIVVTGDVEMGMGAEITTRAEEGSTGDAGLISIRAGRLLMQRAFGLSSETVGSGSAGLITVEAGEVDVDDSTITSSAESELGSSGAVLILADTLRVRNGGTIRTNSGNTRPAGDILILADAVTVEGPSEISSANNSQAAGAAGMILMWASALTVAEGGEISTSSDLGAAGNIEIAMPEGSILRLEGDTAPGTITTSSGPGTGGRITIADPYAIISDGGSILALGEQGGANVQIQTDFFISSADRPNLVAVDGNFLLEAQVGDMSRGTVDRDLSVLDASGVLRGQCAAARRTGEVSQLVVRPLGPLASRETDSAPSPLGPCL